MATAVVVKGDRHHSAKSPRSSRHHHRTHVEHHVEKDSIHTTTTVTVSRTGVCGSVLAASTRAISLITAVLLLIIGISHAVLAWKRWCDDSVCGDDDDCECFGPWLVVTAHSDVVYEGLLVASKGCQLVIRGY